MVRGRFQGSYHLLPFATGIGSLTEPEVRLEYSKLQNPSRRCPTHQWSYRYTWWPRPDFSCLCWGHKLRTTCLCSKSVQHKPANTWRLSTSFQRTLVLLVKTAFCMVDFPSDIRHKTKLLEKYLIRQYFFVVFKEKKRLNQKKIYLFNLVRGGFCFFNFFIFLIQPFHFLDRTIGIVSP